MTRCRRSCKIEDEVATLASWTHFNPVRIISAPGSCSNIGDHIDYRRVVLVTSPGFIKRGVVDRIRISLGERLVAVVGDVKPNPDVRDVDTQGAAIRAMQPDCIVGLGGGSSMDTAKGLARLLSQATDMTMTAHFREGRAFSPVKALPLVAIPTTAGTGAEVTPFGTIWDFEQERKYSVSGDDLYPAVALLDPELSLGLPEDVTISSGLDAISHALESAWNRNATPITLSFSAKSLQLSLPALPQLKHDLGNVQARAMMMQASLLAGLAISQTRTALAHSISYPLTTRFGLPHGIACSFTLPVLMTFNAAADDGRLKDLARSVGYESIAAFAKGLSTIFHQLGVATMFRRYLPTPDSALMLIDGMVTPGRADNNLRALLPGDLEKLLNGALRQVEGGYGESI